MEDVDEAIKSVSGYRTVLGGIQSRLQSAVNNLETSHINLEEGKSRILDADIAESAGKLASANIRKNAGISLLAQANHSSANLQRLIG